MSRHALDEAARALYDLCASIDSSAISHTADTVLRSGTALSPAKAAGCTRDGTRVAAFLRGLRDAIADARGRFPDETIEIVYAGTGPFASLALPLMTILSPSEVRFTLIDCHEESVRALQAILRHFGFDPFVRAVIVGDATTYRHGSPMHIVIGEVMQQALKIEPHVEIMRNLAVQLLPGGIVVPQAVSVDLSLGDIRVGNVVELNGGALCGRTVTIPAVADGVQARYLTTIRTYGRHLLREFECGLTDPEIVSDLTDLREGERIAFSYVTGERPGIRWERVRPQGD